MSGVGIAAPAPGGSRRRPLFDATAAVAREGDGPALYRAIETALGELIGFKLLTVLRVENDHLVRPHSSDLAKYPAGGAKRITGDAWLEAMLRSGVPAISNGEAQVRERFYDHEAIFGIGCGAVLNMPVCSPRGALGSVNLLDVEGHFTPTHIEHALPFVQLLGLAWRRGPG